MDWKIFKISEIPEEDLDIEFARFKNQHIKITELFSKDSLQVKLFFKNCKTPLEYINKVLLKIKYPLDILQRPTDFHYYQAFRKYPTKCILSYRKETDYWQFAWETAWLEYGDCEDSSILLHTGMLLCGVNSYWIIGQVFEDNTFLSGHAFNICKLDDYYRLVESTFDKPILSINKLPIVDINKSKWKVGNFTYEGFLMLKNLDEIWIRKDLVSELVGSLIPFKIVFKNILARYMLLARVRQKEKVKKLRENFAKLIEV